MNIGDKYSFIGKEIVGEMFFTDGEKYLLKSFNGDGDPVLIDDRGNDHPWSVDAFNECFKKIVEGPIRTVTRREIVAGQYGHIEISDVNEEGASLWLPRNKRWTSDQLREAAHILNQIAEVIAEENGK